jgi:hypothetical protein
MLVTSQRTDSIFIRRAFDAKMLEMWEKYDASEAGLCISMMHPDYPALFRMSEAEEFFHFCLKEFDRSRVVSTGVIADDSEMTDVLENEADEEDGGDVKLDVKKKLPEPTYYRGDDDDDATDDIPMAKLAVKDKPF